MAESVLVLLLFLLTGHIYQPMPLPVQQRQQYVCSPAIQAALEKGSKLDPKLFCRKAE